MGCEPADANHEGLWWSVHVMCVCLAGAGKSSLLDCISLRNQKFRGQVFVDDQPAGADYFGRTGKGGDEVQAGRQ